MDQAYAEARAILNKDISFRRWATEHGGVYVPMTETQRSIPWLSHVPGRDITTADGRQLTLLNPASVLRQVMDRHAKDFGIRGRITGLKYLNPGNAPDVWETEQLHSFVRGDRTEVWSEATIDGHPFLRYLRAMYMEPGCEKCHAVLGYRLGDLRGATGLNLPLASYFQELDRSYLTLGTSHGAIWLLGLLGIGWAGRRASQIEREREESRARIAKAELWYRTLFEQSPDGILIFDPATERFVDFNHTAHEALGYDRESFASIRVADFEVEEHAEQTTARIRKIAQQGWDQFETRHRRKNGEIIDVHVVIQQLNAGDKPFFLCSFRDITEAKRAQIELAQHRDHLEQEVARRTRQLADKNLALEASLNKLNTAQAQLVQAEKLAGLGALVAGVAHELNTPIGNSRTVASSLKESTQEFIAQLKSSSGLRRSALDAYINRMNEGVELLEHNMIRAVDLVQSFKQVAVDRTTSVRRQFNLHEVFSDVISTLGPTLKKTPFVLDLDVPSQIALDGYPGPLGQVIVNLVENAIRHGLEGRPQGCIQVGAREVDDALVEWWVSDDGRGISDKNLPRIFDPFFTTTLGRGGSGLGLHIVHNLVVGVLGGTIKVQSQENQGTRFVIQMPKTAPVGRSDEGRA